MITLTHEAINPEFLEANLENNEVEYTGELETISFSPEEIFGYDEETFQSGHCSSVYVTVHLLTSDDELISIVHLNTTLESFEEELEILGYETESSEKESMGELIQISDFQRKAA